MSLPHAGHAILYVRNVISEERCLKYFRCLEEFCIVKISKDDEIITTNKFHCCSTNITIVILVSWSAVHYLPGPIQEGGLGSTELALSDVSEEVNLIRCLQGDGVTLASELTLAGGQKIARVYKQRFTGRATLQPRTTLCAVTLRSKGLETIKKLTHVDGLPCSVYKRKS